MHETILHQFKFEFGEKPQKSLNGEPKFKNPKLAQFWENKIWTDGKFYKLSKYQFCQIFCSQKYPEKPCFLTVFLTEGLFCEVFGKLKGLFVKPSASQPWCQADTSPRRAVALACSMRRLTPGRRPHRACLLAEPPLTPSL